METQEQNAEEKKPYIKPEAKRFPLRPEEAVLGNCKSSVSAGQNGASNCVSFGICNVQGS
jgi:hypothetical protein